LQVSTLAHVTLDTREHELSDKQAALKRLREDLHKKTELHLTQA